MVSRDTRSRKLRRPGVSGDLAPGSRISWLFEVADSHRPHLLQIADDLADRLSPFA